MKVTNYHQLLKARGYKAKELSKYQGQNIFEKEHKYNKVVCTVIKDTHGKAQEMRWCILPNYLNVAFEPFNMEQFRQAEFDRNYLVKEIQAIHTAFEKLKEMKSPKHIIF